MRRLALLLLAAGTALAQPLLPPQPGQIPVTLRTDQTSYAIGEIMQVEIRASRNCRFLLYYLDSAGAAHLVVPSSFSRHDKLYAGQTLRVVDREGHPLEQNGPAGVEHLQVIVTAEPLPLARFKNLVGSAGEVPDPQAFVGAVQRELAARPFGQATTTYTVREQGSPR